MKNLTWNEIETKETDAVVLSDAEKDVVNGAGSICIGKRKKTKKSNTCSGISIDW